MSHPFISYLLKCCRGNCHHRPVFLVNLLKYNIINFILMKNHLTRIPVVILMLLMSAGHAIAQQTFPEPAPLPALPELLEDVMSIVNANPKDYKYKNNLANWCAVGIRNVHVDDNWNIYLYDDTLFTSPPVAQSTYGVGTSVDFVVVDNNHSPLKYRGIRASSSPGLMFGRAEFEGGDETLAVGPLQTYSWVEYDVVEMYDIQLNPGNYTFILRTSNPVTDMGFGLYKSNGSAYYAGRSAAIASKDLTFGYDEESFSFNITSSDWYGLCVWSNNGVACDYSLEITLNAYWEGTVSTNWNTAGNWSTGVVPDYQTNVIINSGTPFQPVIGNGLSASCKNLTIGSSAVLTQNATSYLNVYGDFISNLGTFTQNGTSYLYFKGSGNTDWYDANSNDTYTNIRVEKTNSDDRLQLSSDVVVATSVSVREGILDRYWEEELTINGTGSSALEVQAGGTLDGGNISVAGGAIFLDGSNVSLTRFEIGKNFRVENNTAYDFQLGEVVFNGSGTQYIQDIDGNTVFWNVRINKPSGTVYIDYNDLHVDNDMFIESGILSTTNGPSPTATYNIHINGHWFNNVGPSAFIESTSSVFFEGLDYQICDTETFHTLVIDKTDALGIFHVDGGTVTCSVLKLDLGKIYVMSGHFIANDLFYNGITGNYKLAAGGQIDLSNADGYVDLNGNLEITGGLFNVHGGTSMSYWPWSTNASITMSGGILDFKGQGIRINNSGFSLTQNITGGTIRTAGNLHCYRTDWNLSKGTFEMYGSTNATYYQVNGSKFNNLVFNKGITYTLDGEPQNPYMNREKDDIRSNDAFSPGDGPLLNTVTASTTMDLKGSLTLSSGTLDPNDTIYLAGNWTNTAGAANFLESGSTVVFNGNTSAQIIGNEQFNTMVVDKTASGSLDLVIDGYISMTDDMKILQGTLEMNTGSTLSVGDDLRIESNAGLNADDAAPVNIHIGGDWEDFNTTVSSSVGFNAGTGSKVTFNAGNTGVVQAIRSVLPFNEITISSEAPYVMPSPLTRLIHCRKLDIQQGLLRTFIASKIHVEQLLDISGQLQLMNPDDSVVVDGDIIWRSGSSGSISTGQFLIGNDWTFESGTNVVLTAPNQVIFNTAQTSTIRCDDADARFGNLVINKSGSSGNHVYIHTSSLDTMRVSGTMTLQPNSTFQVQSAKIIVTGELNIQPGSSMNLSTGFLKNTYSWFQLGGNLAVNSGTVVVNYLFILEPTGNLIIQGGSFTSLLENVLSLCSFRGRLELSSGTLDIHSSVEFIAGFDCQVSGGLISTGGTIWATSPLVFQPSGGTVLMNGPTGSGNYYIYCDNGNFFHNLNIHGNFACTGNLAINNDLTIEAGFLNPQAFTVYIGGDWMNLVGPDGFVESTGKVVFNSTTQNQQCSDEIFNNLELAKGYTYLNIPAGAEVQCSSYDWTSGLLRVNGGSFEAADLADNGLMGKYYLGPLGGMLELHQDTLSGIDLNGEITIENGSMLVYGGNTQSNWPGVQDAALTMYGGVLDFPNQGIRLKEDPANDLTLNLTGGKIRTSKHFHAERSGFTPAAGTVELYGNETNTVMHAAGNYFNNLLINKIRAESGTIFPDSDIEVHGELLVEDGYLIAENETITVFQDVRINHDATFALMNSGVLKMTNGDSIIVNNGGFFTLNGAPGAYATVCGNTPSDFYHLTFYSGSTALFEHGNFRNLGPSGVNIRPGAHVSTSFAFNFCTFENGISGGSLITIDNDESLFINEAVFPTNTWGGQSNVKKGVNTGNVTFTNYSGDFAGEAFENDPYNRITWVEPINISLTAVPSNLCEGSSSQLNAIVTGGAPPYLYSWSPAGSLSNSSITNPIATPMLTTTYTLTVTDDYGSTETAGITVTVNEPPAVSCPPGQSLCIDNNILFLENLSVFPPSNSSSSVFTGPGVTPAEPENGFYNFDPLAAGAGTHTITYTYTDANGCSNSCTFTITVHSLPEVLCPEDTGVCFYSGVLYLEDLDVWPLSNSTNSVFTGPGVNAFNPALGQYDFYPVTAGTGTHLITYTYTDTDGCSNFCTFNITVYPQTELSCPAELSLCIDDPPSPLTGASPAGGTYSGPGVSGNIFSPAIAGSGSHTVLYTYTDGNGCTSVCAFLINVNELPTVTCSVLSVAVCYDADIFFLESLPVFPPSNSFSSVFTGPGVTPAAPALGQYNFNPLLAGIGIHTITYTYTDANGCSNSCTIPFVVSSPIANAGEDVMIMAGNSTVLNGNASGGWSPYTFAWSPAESLNNPNIQSPIATPAVTTTYTLTVTDEGSCTATDQVTVSVLPAGTGILNGNITYANAASSSLSEVSVRLEQAGVPLFTTSTGAGGYYEFNGIPAGNYQLRCTSATPWGGVNAIDAQLVMRHFVHMINLTGMSLIAANVDLISVINTIDALMISKRFTEVISSFPLGDWYFEPFDVNIEGGISQTQDIKGICLGDVNNSYLPPYKTPPRALLVEKGELQASAGAVTEIPVCCTQDLAVGSISLVVEYPANDMKIMGVSCDYDAEYLVFNEVNGTLRIAWFSPQARFFTAGSPIIRLSAIVTKAEDFKLRALAESELSDQDGICIQDCELSYPKIRLLDESFASSVELRPNPFSETAALLIRTTCPSDLNIKFFTADGQLVSAMKRQLPGTGLHQIELDGCQMSAGSYYCLVEMQEKDMIRTHRIKVIIIR